MPRIQPFWNSEKVMSSSAIFISLVTLIAMIYQSNLMREEYELARQAQFASTMPYLMLSNMNGNGPNHTLTLRNNGLGPAFIDSVIIEYQDSVYYTDLPNFLYDNVPEVYDIPSLYHSNLSPGQLMAAGESLNMLQVIDSQESTDSLLSTLSRLSGLRYRVIYRSVYNERWEINTDRLQPVKLE